MDTKREANRKSWSYLLRVLLSFVLLVLLLDLGWSALSSQRFVGDETDPESTQAYWQGAFVSLLTSEIEDLQPESFSLAASQLSAELEIGVQIEPLDSLHLDMGGTSGLDQTQLIERNGESFLLLIYPQNNALVRVGPLPQVTSEWPSYGVTLVFYLLISLLIWVWIRPLVRGLDLLSEATHKFASNYREPLPPLQVRSPVKELAQSIEAMADQIRTLIETQVELTGGLSHEIRTPLARIKFALASARSSFGEQTQFDSIEQDLNELEHLVEAMLDYSRLQQAEALTHWQPLDSSAILSGLVEKYRWRTSAKIEVLPNTPSSGATKDQRLNCDLRLMPLAISNLLANATRYADESIRIQSGFTKTGYFVSVGDDGPGIPKDKHSQAILPFKKNAGINDQSDGFGLGLAIVNRIAKLHGGEVQLSRSSLGGLEVSIFWPEPTMDCS